MINALGFLVALLGLMFPAVAAAQSSKSVVARWCDFIHAFTLAVRAFR